MNNERNPHGRKVHTPGPWDVQDPLGDGPNKWIYADGLYIAEVDGEREEAEANARLIAAAPELLDRLQEYYDHQCALKEESRDLAPEDLQELEALLAGIQGTG